MKKVISIGLILAHIIMLSAFIYLNVVEYSKVFIMSGLIALPIYFIIYLSARLIWKIDKNYQRVHITALIVLLGCIAVFIVYKPAYTKSEALNIILSTDLSREEIIEVSSSIIGISPKASYFIDKAYVFTITTEKNQYRYIFHPVEGKYYEVE
jgi:hypothetical protein